MPNSPSKRLPSQYEIAVPQSYDAFDLSAATPSPVVEVAKTSTIALAPKESAQKTHTHRPKKTADDWIDSRDETPKVKEKDKDKFEPPDEDSGGPSGAGVKSTIEKFAGSGRF